MPELPEVETVRRGLEDLLIGRSIVGIDVRDRRLRSLVEAAVLERWVQGRRVVQVSRRAKYLLLHLQASATAEESRLIVHLGMSGQLVAVRAATPLEPHTHVVFRIDDGRELRFRDPRRFGLVDALPASAVASDRRFRDLGVEPLSDECTSERFVALSRGVRKPVKNFLMDAQRVVGVGNIYACEALWVAGVHPLRAAGRISARRWARITESVQDVLRRAIARGGTTLNDFHDAYGGAGWFQVELRVYGREGEACSRCRGAIRRRVLAGRSTYFCSGCQR